MKLAIEKFIENNDSGLFLLDSPTGFGKTYAVKKILKEYLSGEKHQNVERMFFITNLKTNLPYEELCEELAENEKVKCARIKAFDEDVIENWDKIEIPQEEIKKSKEYKALKSDIEILKDLEREKKDLQTNNQSFIKKQKAIGSFENKIATVTEPAFREFIKKNYFNGKSVVDKRDFIQKNEWFRKIYPISEMEKKKVVFMTTAKFFSPISVFYRMPFFVYSDSIINNSVVFIDEFDATKQTVLDQIIDNSLKINVDIISLFTNIHYVLQGLEFPQKLLKMAEKKQNEEENAVEENSIRYFTSTEILKINKEKFKAIYEKHNFDLLLKSTEFKDNRAFLFDDGNNITVYTDNSRKHLAVKDDRNENYIKLTANSFYIPNKSLNELLRDVQDCIKFFVNGVKFLSNNYFRTVNTNKQGEFEYKYSQDEALMTILSAFNLNGDNRDYLQNILTDGRYSIESNENITRKGFKFVEIEDSNYHDLQSIAHQFNFETTPENLIILIAEKARLVGISATATIPTVIGNYDLIYISDVLKNKYIKILSDDKARIEEDFKESQKIYDQVKISVSLIDDLNTFSDKEKAQLLLEHIFKGNLLEKYMAMSETRGLDAYYFLMMVKLTYLYNEVGTKNINSFIVFQNRFPRNDDNKLDFKKLEEMFLDAAANNGYDKFSHYAIQSDNFDEEMQKVYESLAENRKCFLISTYKTLGSGKNIQYAIPDSIKNELIIDEKGKPEKDFDGIYLMTPTNLTQRLDSDSDDKFRDLSKYLYQQQSLYLNDKITNGQYRQNVVSGFRRVFFSDFYSPYYNKNSDMCCHTTQLAIQAIGRICRCRNKNKQIHIYADTEIVERAQRVKHILADKILNKEFSELLNKTIETQKVSTIQDYSRKSKAASVKIRQNAYTVRSSVTKVNEWQALRDYVLRNPTTDFVLDKYEDLYFRFDTKTNGFSYKPDANFNIIDLKLDTREDMTQVSAQDCELPIMMSIPCVKELFQTEKYAGIWKRSQYVMTPSLYNQVYKGALGEVVGKKILEEQLGWELKEIDDYTQYEFFDFKLKNIYFDFKHWKLFIKDPKTYIESIKRKLNKVNGEKCIIVNIIKRGKHIVRENIDEDVIQIPYLIDPLTNEISIEMIEEIEKHII